MGALLAVLRRLFLRTAGGVHGAPVHHQPVIDIFRDQIQHHVQKRHQILVPMEGIRQIAAQQGGQGREGTVVQQHQRHGLWDVVGALEGELSVQGEVPQHREGQSDEIAGPVAPVQQLIEQGKGGHFDGPGGDGEQGEFQHPSPLSFVFHGVSRSFLRVTGWPCGEGSPTPSRWSGR